MSSIDNRIFKDVQRKESNQSKREEHKQQIKLNDIATKARVPEGLIRRANAEESLRKYSDRDVLKAYEYLKNHQSDRLSEHLFERVERERDKRLAKSSDGDLVVTGRRPEGYMPGESTRRTLQENVHRNVGNFFKQAKHKVDLIGVQAKEAFRKAGKGAKNLELHAFNDKSVRHQKEEGAYLAHLANGLAKAKTKQDRKLWRDNHKAFTEASKEEKREIIKEFIKYSTRDA